MKILIGKTFGIGNAICSIPMIKAIYSLGHDVELLVGSLPDDFGAKEVLKHLGLKINVDHALENEYDLAIMAIPFDGRWKNGVHYKATEVWDERPRPFSIIHTGLGFKAWKKHEVKYQMENAKKLGYNLLPNGTPNCSFLKKQDEDNMIIVGTGYKKDKECFWAVKHWGNENYAELIKLLLHEWPAMKVMSVGDAADLSITMGPIKRLVKDNRYVVKQTSLEESFKLISKCSLYIGNDTGMMHVASSCDKRVAVYFNMENASTKSRPWCNRFIVLDNTKQPVTIKDMFEAAKTLSLMF